MAKTIKRVSDVFFTAIVIILVTYFALRATNRIEIYNVKTGSMEDNIHVGDYILILKKSDYKVGDIVTFQRDGYFITHRIIKKEKNIITTKGDANNVEDASINENAIIGKAILIGGILNFIITYKYSLSGALLAIYLITCYIGKNKEEENKEENIEKNENENKEEILEDNDESLEEVLEVEENKEEMVEIDEPKEDTSTEEKKPGSRKRKTRKSKK